MFVVTVLWSDEARKTSFGDSRNTELRRRAALEQTCPSYNTHAASAAGGGANDRVARSGRTRSEQQDMGFGRSRCDALVAL